jgi:hypothetical protein
MLPLRFIRILILLCIYMHKTCRNQRYTYKQRRCDPSLIHSAFLLYPDVRIASFLSETLTLSLLSVWELPYRHHTESRERFPYLLTLNANPGTDNAISPSFLFIVTQLPAERY